MKGLVLIALVLLAVFEMLERYDRPPALPFVHASVPLAVPAQAVTNPRGEARTSMRVAPCVTVDPVPVQLEDQA